MSGIIITGSFPQALRPGINKWVGDVYKDYAPLYSKIFKVEKPDSRAYVEDAVMSGMSLLVAKDESAGIRFDAAKQDYSPRYDHLAYGLGFIITMEMLEDGLAMSKAQRYTKMLMRSALQTRETVSHLILSRGFNSSYTQSGGDGVELMSTAHPTRGGNVSNKLSTDADLSEAALEQAVIDIRNLVDNRGLRMSVMPKTLVVPTASQFEAHRILESQLRVGTANNDPNALKAMGYIQDVVVSPYLTSDTDAWYIITDVPDGLKFMNRKDPTMTSDNDFDTENAKFKVLMRFSVGWTDFRGIYGSQGA